MKYLLLLLLTGCGSFAPMEEIHHNVNAQEYVGNSCLQIAADKVALMSELTDDIEIRTGYPYASTRAHAVVVADGMVYDVKGDPFPESELYLLGEFN